PSTGLVLVIGDNGEGKSTLAEAVAQCGWGEPSRGKPGWRTGEASGVQVDVAGGHIKRSVHKGSQKLSWRGGGAGAGAYATRPKSREGVESRSGSGRVRRPARTCHTKNASQFTCWTDAERARLLEESLQGGYVDAACRRSLDEHSVSKKEDPP